MKKVFIAVAIVLGGLSSYATSEVALRQVNVIVMEAEYKEIKVSELPKAVLDALATDFNTATLDKAYVNDKQEYKLHITIQEVTSAVHAEKVYADKYGNWINKGKISIPVRSTSEEITNNFK